jgi:hypothetical protein
VTQRLNPDRLLWIGRQVLFGLGAAIAVFYWWQLNQTGNSVDAHAYWIADPNNLYPHPELLEKNGYEYSPAFELVIGWGRLLPFAVFAAIWRGILLATLVWLAGPLTLFVIFVPAVASEINAGNIQILLAAAIVLGFRWPGTWAFVILTKVSPGIGLAWFLLRRQWRQFAIAVGLSAAIALVTFVIWPGRWFDYAKLLTAGTPPPVSPFYWSFWVRLPFAVGFVLLGAWRGWRWPVVVAAMFALPQFYFISPSLLVGVLPFLRSATGRWLDRRRQAPERLREQANPASGAILAG